MSEISEEIRHLILFHYRKGNNASKTCREVCAIYGEDAVSDRTMRNWFERFRGGNLDVKDLPRSGRPLTEKADQILDMIKIDRHASCQDIADALGINHQTVWNHLKRAGYSKKLDVWVPHKLTMRNLINRVDISETLVNRNKMDPFLKRLITGDEKWIKYESIKRKRSASNGGETSQTTAKGYAVCMVGLEGNRLL